jgi:hypothetical protein
MRFSPVLEQDSLEFPVGEKGIVVPKVGQKDLLAAEKVF